VAQVSREFKLQYHTHTHKKSWQMSPIKCLQVKLKKKLEWEDSFLDVDVFWSPSNILAAGIPSLLVHSYLGRKSITKPFPVLLSYHDPEPSQCKCHSARRLSSRRWSSPALGGHGWLMSLNCDTAFALWFQCCVWEVQGEWLVTFLFCFRKKLAEAMSPEQQFSVGTTFPLRKHWQCLGVCLFVTKWGEGYDSVV
jgi:hypothetical protein